MFRAAAIVEGDKADQYRSLAEQVSAVVAGERDPIANAANICALLFDALPDVNWAGFYFLRSNRELVLGPFQGKPACVRIVFGRGVCGSAVAQRRSLLVADVHAFPGHIACDAASRSELVVPLMAGEDVLGVIDLDSPSVSRFDSDDQAGIEKIAALYVAASDRP
jgi:GAF domain-containing protein